MHHLSLIFCALALLLNLPAAGQQPIPRDSLVLLEIGTDRLYRDIPTYEIPDALEWGVIPPDDLAMEIYAPDTAARAVLLDDQGHLATYINPDYAVFLDVHYRIKILRPAGLDLADIGVDYNVAQGEMLDSLRARITHRDGSYEEIEGADFFKEDLGGQIVLLKAALPNAAVGDIVEVRYRKLYSDPFLLPRWYFQTDYPCRSSQLSFHLRFNRYVHLFIGLDDLEAVRDSTIFETPAGARLYRTPDMLKMTDIPALIPEPYIDNYNNHVAQVRFQLQKTIRQEEFMHNWPEFARRMRTNVYFGRRYTVRSNTVKINRLAGKAVPRTGSLREQLTGLYQFVHTTFPTEDRYGYFAPLDLDNYLKSANYDEGIRQLILLALLRRRGITADPVLVSTRSHGAPIEFYPAIDQFNYVLIRAEVDGEVLLLDVGDRPPGYIRTDLLNGRGWHLASSTQQWIPIEAPPTRGVLLITAALSASGQLTGDVRLRETGFDGLERAAAGPDAADWRARLETRLNGAEMTDVTVSDQLADEGYTELKTSFDAPDYTEAGARIYLSPLLQLVEVSNPYTLPSRHLPLSLPQAKQQKFVLELTLPEGYTMEEMPQSARLDLPNDDAKFRYVVGVKDDKLRVTCSIAVNRTEWPVTTYGALRDFHQQVAEKMGEMIVLRRVN